MTGGGRGGRLADLHAIFAQHLRAFQGLSRVGLGRWTPSSGPILSSPFFSEELGSASPGGEAVDGAPPAPQLCGGCVGGEHVLRPQEGMLGLGEALCGGRGGGVRGWGGTRLLGGAGIQGYRSEEEDLSTPGFFLDQGPRGRKPEEASPPEFL